MEDKKISDISKLLYGGAKMLSYHCPECKFPLFKEDERIFCPSCGRDVIIESEQEKADNNKTEEAPEITPEVDMSLEPKDVNLNEANLFLKATILRLSRDLKNAKNLNEIKEIVETIDKITSVLERVKKLN
jgi:UPF0148 protein